MVMTSYEFLEMSHLIDYFRKTVKDCVVINFICQLDWAIGCLDIWSKIILGASVRVFLGEIII